MTQTEGTSPPPTQSSFPVSSPSFWTEAATNLIPSPPRKRHRDDSSSDYELGFELDVDALDQELKPVIEAKRPRCTSPDDRSKTTLSYLSNRADPINQDDPHAYLANAEYAPNRFGDIGDYMRKKEIKVQTQNRDIALASAASGLPQIFAGQSFYINGNTHPPMEELRKMILQRGGEVRPVLRNKGMVKYIIAPMLTLSKFKQFQNYKVVREGWILESCKQEKLLDWSRWKLQIEGGWEQGSRKGMEGFLKSQPMASQRETASISKEEFPPIDDPLVQQTDKPPVTPLKLPAIGRRTLLAPTRESPGPIPISPSKLNSDTEGTTSPIPSKIQKAEGAWEFYHNKKSNENAAKALKNQEWRLKNTAERGNEGGFIDGYYQNSRLHHLSTWKAELKVLVADAQRKSEELSLSNPSTSTIAPFSLANSILPSRLAGMTATNVSSTTDKVIFHVDFDCFFVSCGVATRPHLKGKPTVVCHSQAGKGASSTSEIASSSYEARAKGVKNGMSLGRARQLVGDELQTIPYEFETYKKYSLAFYTVLMGYADELQAVSVDEALIDVTSAVAAKAMSPESTEVAEMDDELVDNERPIRPPRDPAVEVADQIRNDVRNLTDGCEVSIGISHNILLAKLATRHAKPAGVYHLLRPAIPSFLGPLDVEDFPSIGYSIRSKIEDKFGTTTVDGLLDVSKGSFRGVLGPKTGEMLWGYLRGYDERKLEADKARKSVSAEMNYGIRFQNQDQAEICVNDLAAEVSKRMVNLGVKGRQITLKLLKRHPDAPIEPPKFLGHGWCETFNRSAAISAKGGGAGPTDDPEILGQESVKLLRAMRLDPVELRGVGIQVTKLDSEKEKKEEEREVGQGVLSFARKRETFTAKRSETPKAEPPPEVLPSKQQVLGKEVPSIEGSEANAPVIQVEEQKASLVKSAVVDFRLEAELTPALAVGADSGPDGIDPDFLAALPPELQLEVRRDHAQSLAKNRHTARATSEKPNASTGPSTRNTARANTTSPAKSKMNEAAHITRQLRPKTKTQMNARALAERPLFGAWAKAQAHDRDQDVVDLTALESGPSSDRAACAERHEKIGGYEVAELRDLGIDPEVFGALPDEMGSEIVNEERRKARQRQLLHRPGVDGNLRLNDRSRSREVSAMSISPTKSSRAGSAPPGAAGAGAGMGPRIVISRPKPPSLMNSTDIEDVTDTIEKWIESRKGKGPAGRDAGKVMTYLKRCVGIHKSGCGLGGVERAVEVLKWMRVLLGERWADQEEVMGDDDDELEEDVKTKAGREWWIVWRGFRDQIDKICEERLGAGLRI
ncbi:hypothetical protein IAR55_001647 [Kwoniella newhampshirensis]|uniref:DNA repair protein REV1 n=1 Tax=Kwoniella newhampshirensis TaxID=1651941 RepID=A0AAW0Z2L1_9TREE